MSSLLLDSDRVDLTEPCKFWLSEIPAKAQKQMVKDFFKAAEEWKLGQADENGLVLEYTKNALAGLLGGDPPLVKMVPAKDADIFRCAGPNVWNEIDLAFFLWIAKAESFERVLQTHGTAEVFSMAGMLAFPQADARSLIRLNQFLVSFMADFANSAVAIAKKSFPAGLAFERRMKQLGDARNSSAKARSSAAKERKALLQQAAAEYRRANPAAKLDAIADYLFGLNRWKLPSLNSPSRATIRDAIKGLGPR